MFRSQYHRIIALALSLLLIQAYGAQVAFATSCRQDSECYEAALRADRAVTSEQRQSAIAALIQIASRLSDPRIAAVIGRLYLKEKQYTLALEFCEKARMRAPGDEELQQKVNDCIDVSNREIRNVAEMPSPSVEYEGTAGKDMQPVGIDNGNRKRRRPNKLKSHSADQYRLDRYPQSLSEKPGEQQQIPFSNGSIDSNPTGEAKTIPANRSKSSKIWTIVGVVSGVGLALGLGLGIYAIEPRLDRYQIVPLLSTR